MEFHDSQKQAITHVNGPMMVLAGPGSGKTTVITHRTRHLIKECGVHPSSILVITFTKAAATEMKERFTGLMAEESQVSSSVHFGTFHGIFFRILKHAYGFHGGNIVREEQQKEFLKELIEQCEIEVEDENELVHALLSEISNVKGELIDTNYYYAKNCSEENFKKIYFGYEEKMRNQRLIDFDDMLVMCYELFSQRKDILSAWQRRFQYILVDEFQDINRIQYEIVRMLAAPEHNLFIVGDDDQSIYRFRGAKPEIMLGFEKDYENSKRVLLGINYRCSDAIVKAASTLIAHNKDRFLKEITSMGAGGRPVQLRVFENPVEETMQIVREVLDYSRVGYELSDIAVLYRTNLSPRLLIEKLMEFNVAFSVKDVVPNLYDHWICNNILTYIKVAMGNRERGNFLKIINRPKRYVSRDAFDTPVVSFEQIKNFYQDKDWMVERIEQLEYDLRMLQNMAPAAAVNYIRKGCGYDEYIIEYANDRRMKPEELLEVADQLQESAAGFSTYESWFLHMQEYAKQLKEQASQRQKEKEGLTLMTMHSSKGLEYKIVYILDANEGVVPHQKAILKEDLEEERRMFYVAMTRAKERLSICAVKTRYQKKQELSRFVKEVQGEEERRNK